MKTRTLVRVMTLAFVAALAAKAQAASTGNLFQDVQSATGGDGNVSVTVDGNTATLTGYVHSSHTAKAVRRAVLSHEGIDEVIDLISDD